MRRYATWHLHNFAAKVFLHVGEKQMSKKNTGSVFTVPPHTKENVLGGSESTKVRKRQPAPKMGFLVALGAVYATTRVLRSSNKS